MQQGYKTLAIHIETFERVKSFGARGQTMNGIIETILDLAEAQRKTSE